MGTIKREELTNKYGTTLVARIDNTDKGYSCVKGKEIEYGEIVLINGSWNEVVGYSYEELSEELKAYALMEEMRDLSECLSPFYIETTLAINTDKKYNKDGNEGTDYEYKQLAPRAKLHAIQNVIDLWKDGITIKVAEERLANQGDIFFNIDGERIR